MDIIYETCRILQVVLQARSPYDTGNLCNNAIRIVNRNSIVIGGEIADYAVFTNEPWTRGKNPNQGWVQKAIQEAIPIIQQVIQGKATSQDLKDTYKKYNDIKELRKEKWLKYLEAKREKIAG